MKECVIVVHRNYAEGLDAHAFFSEEDARRSVTEAVEGITDMLQEEGYTPQSSLIMGGTMSRYLPPVATSTTSGTSSYPKSSRRSESHEFDPCGNQKEDASGVVPDIHWGERLHEPEARKGVPGKNPHPWIVHLGHMEARSRAPCCTPAAKLLSVLVC